MKNLKHLKHMLATWAFNGMSSCCFDELRLVVVEVDGGVWSSLCGGGTSNSPMGRLHTKLTALACLLEHPLWRLAGSVEVAAARWLGGGGRGERADRGKHGCAVWCDRERGGGGRTRPGNGVEMDRSERERDGEFYFFWAGCERESEYVSVRTDIIIDIKEGMRKPMPHVLDLHHISSITRCTLLDLHRISSITQVRGRVRGGGREWREEEENTVLVKS
jgi:hypothetical protein